jgi:hypothetical protein
MNFATADLFDTRILAGFASSDEFIRQDEEAGLIAGIDVQPLSPFRFSAGLGSDLHSLSADPMTLMLDHSAGRPPFQNASDRSLSGYISQLERGTKKATGSTLAILNVIRRKGIEAVI